MVSSLKGLKFHVLTIAVTMPNCQVCTFSNVITFALRCAHFTYTCKTGFCVCIYLLFARYNSEAECKRNHSGFQPNNFIQGMLYPQIFFMFTEATKKGDSRFLFLHKSSPPKTHTHTHNIEVERISSHLFSGHCYLAVRYLTTFVFITRRRGKNYWIKFCVNQFYIYFRFLYIIL